MTIFSFFLKSKDPHYFEMKRIEKNRQFSGIAKGKETISEKEKMEADNKTM